MMFVLGHHGIPGIPAVPHVEGGPGTELGLCAAILNGPLNTVLRSAVLVKMITGSLRVAIRTATMEEHSMIIVTAQLPIMALAVVIVSCKEVIFVKKPQSLIHHKKLNIIEINVIV